MALRDCFRKVKGISADDRADVITNVAHGMVEKEAVRSVLAQAVADLLSITDQVELAGGLVQRSADPLTDIAALQSRILDALHQERINLNDEINEITIQLGEIQTIEDHIRGYPALRGMDIDGPVNLDDLQQIQGILSAMFFDPANREALSRGVAGLKGDSPIELERSYEALQQRKHNLQAESRKLDDRNRQLDERLKTIFYGERRNPRKLFQDFEVQVPWKVKSTGEGDLYIRRHGVNAGTPFRERQGPNDFAISFNQDVLLPDYMFYLLTYLQPKVAARARGTAQQFVTLDDINAVLTNHFMGQELFQSGSGPRLQALHNLTTDDLSFADNIGGLANPSIAVLPEDRDLHGFGNITLIGSEDLGDPQQVPLFDADAYAVRTPRAQHKAASVADVEIMSEEAGTWSLKIEGLRYAGLPDIITEYARRRPDAERLVDFMLGNNSAKAWFLNDLYGENPEPTVFDVRPGFVWGWHPGILRFFDGDLSAENLEWDHLTRQKHMRKAGELVRTAIREYFIRKEPKVAPDAEPYAEAARAERIYAKSVAFVDRAGIMNDDGSLTIQAYDRLKRDAALKGSTKIDDVDTATYLDGRIRDRGAEAAFKGWVDAKVHGIMGEPRIKIGNRWYPYTLENMSRKMNGKLRGTETKFPSAGMLRAKAAKRIRNLDEARRLALEQIDTPEKVLAARDISQKMVLDWISDMASWWPYNPESLRAFSDASDAAQEAILFWIQNKDGLSDSAALTRGLERAGYMGPFPDEMIQQGLDAAAATLANPVPYFEAKPQRPVMLSEFVGAVIPLDEGPETRAILQKHGIIYSEYEPGNKAHRTEVLRELQNEITNAGGQTLFQSNIGFTSGLLNAARAMPREKGNAADMLGTLRKMPGVKKAELEWLGVPAWLSVRKNVTRDDLVNFIEQGGIRIEEIILGHVVGKIIKPEDVRAAWDSGRFSHNQLLVAESTDLQLELVKDGRPQDITFDMLTQQQVHSFMAHLQREQGTTVGSFGTTDEQRAARLRVEIAQSHLSSLEYPMNSPQGRVAQREYRDAVNAIRTIAPGWGYADLGDGTYLMQAPEATTWQLAGGENYREVILKMPTISSPALDGAMEIVVQAYADLPAKQKAALNDFYSAATVPPQDAFLRALDKHDVIAADFGAAGLGGSALQRAYEGLSALRDDAMTEFESHVFKEYKNIVGWFRVNDRIGPNGERILFIEETQSDWAKAARKRGIKNLLAIEMMSERLMDLNAQAEALANDRDPDGKMHNETAWHRNRDEADFINRQLATEENKAPPFPFGGSAWMELVMKRVIRMAAEQGYDQIAWTTGEQQANRYNLEKIVKTISAVGRLNADGSDAGRSVSFTANNGRIMSIGVSRAGLVENTERGAPQYWKGRQLEEIIGERLAKQILDADYSQEITGEDLRVGGEGMVAFYDDVLVNVTNRVARTLDKKAKVKKFGGRIPHPDAGHWQITDTRNGWVGHYETEALARQAMDSGGVNNYELEHFDSLARVAVHALDLTEEMVSGALFGMTYFQGKHRASITFDAQRKAIIRMTKARDLTSYLHESAHMWLDIMGDLAEREGANPRHIDDFAKMLKFLGVNHRREIGTKEHEIWAKAQELYFQEGVAPTHELQPIFSAFRQWVLRVYTYIQNYFEGIELTDEIRAVMDRMVATDEAIANAEKVQEFRPIFANAADAGLSQEAFEVYRRNIELAHQGAFDEEHRKQLAYVNRQAKEWYAEERKKVEAIVTAEVHAMPVYIALAMLQKGQNPDGTPTKMTAFKISKESLLRAVQGSQEFLKRFPRPYIYRVKGGVDVDVAAGIFGYTDTETMLQDIVNARPMNELIQFETDEQMNEQFPDPLVDGSLAADALISVHNDKRALVLAAELRALRKLVRRDKEIVGAERQALAREDREAKAAAKGLLPTRPELAIIKRLAQDFISKMQIRQINPHKYRMAEQKAGRRAWLALEKKDYSTAYDEKLKQIRNHEAFRAATKAKEEAGRTQRYLSKFEKVGVQRRLGKAGLLDPILAVIEGIDLRKRSLAQVDRNKALADILEAVKQGHIVVPPETLAKLADVGTNWQDLTAQEFREMRDIVRQLEHMPKRIEMAMVNEEEVVLADVEDEIAAGILDANVVVPFGVAEETGKQSTKSTVREGVYHALSAGSIARILDAGPWGALTRRLVVPIRRAYVEKLIPMIHKYQEDLAAIYTKHYTDPELAGIQKKKKVEGFSEDLSRSDILSIALNWGTEGNRNALLGGMRKDVHGQIIGPAYPQQEVLAALSTLDVRDWAFVQDMWDYLDTYWGALSAAEKRRRGVSPQKVESMGFTITTVDGTEVTLRGGYMHLFYNPKFGDAVKADDLNEIARKMGQGLYVSASTRAGATYNRVKNPGRVVRLGLGGLDQHLREVIRDIAMGDEVSYVMRLLNSDKVRDAFKHTNNEVALRELVLWATDAAVGELPASNIWEKIAGWSRVGFTKSKLAFSVTVTLLQMTGAFQSMAFIGKRNFMMGFGKFLQNPTGHYKYVMENSTFMHTRYGVMQSYSVEVADAQTFMKSVFGPVPTQFKRNFKRFSHYYFFMIAKAQSLVDVWTWMGAYHNGRNNLGQSEADARLFADSQVEGSQTSGIFADRSGLERGTLGNRTRQSQYVRLWTTLISYMLRKQGLAYEATQTFKRGDKTVGAAANLLLDYIMLFMVEGIASQLVYGNWPGDDDEEMDAYNLSAWVALATLDSVVAGIPLVREIATARYGSGNTPIGSLAKDLFDTMIQGMQGEVDEELITTTISALGTALHLPSSQVNRAIEAYMADDAEWYEYLVGTRK